VDAGTTSQSGKNDGDKQKGYARRCQGIGQPEVNEEEKEFAGSALSDARKAPAKKAQAKKPAKRK
jgi:hypothetical protein